TIEELNNLCNKFDEGGPTGVEDSATVDQEGLFVEVNMDGTTERVNKKESCPDGTTGWATKFEVKNLMKEGPTGVKDSTAVDQESSFEEVNMDWTTESINQKESCPDGST
ncbi:hypothetical protein RYX36_007242, partial [Vicia faba]